MFQPREGTLEGTWDVCNGDDALVVEFGLAGEFMLPLATGKLDPFIGVVGALRGAATGRAWIVSGSLSSLFRHPWSESIIRSVTSRADGRPLLRERAGVDQGRRD